MLVTISLLWDNHITSFLKLLDDAVMDIFVRNGFYTFQIVFLALEFQTQYF